MIEVKNVEKSFDEDGGKRQVLFGVNAKFYDGKVNLIIGQSGARKLECCFRAQHFSIVRRLWEMLSSR